MVMDGLIGISLRFTCVGLKSLLLIYIELLTCADEKALNFLPQKRCVCILATRMAYNLSLVSSAMDNSFMLSIFFGVFFDRKLNLIPHRKYIKYNCRKAYYNSCALYLAGIGVVTGQPY